MSPNREKSTERWVLAATVLASSMAFIDQSALTIALPAIQSDLHATGSQLLWFVGGYTLMLAALILLGGTLGDRIGRRRVFFFGILVFTAASTACAAAPSAGFLLVGRLVQGIGGAMMIPGSLSIISTVFPAERRGRAIGTWSAATTLTTAGGPIIGGVLAQAGLWRGVFLINLPLGLAAMAALLSRVPDDAPRADGKGIDLAGSALITLSLAALAFGFIDGPNFGFGSASVIAAFVIGAAALALFILVEHLKPEPMVPLAVFRNITFTGANLLTLFLYGALSAFSFFLPLALVQAQGYSESAAGLTMLPFVVLLAGLSRWAGRLSDRIGPRVPLVVGPLLVGAGFLVCSTAAPTLGAAGYWSTYFPGIILFGVGMGVTVAPLTTTVMTALDRGLTGTASGINNAVSRLAGVLAVAILGALAILHFTGYVLEGASGAGLTSSEHARLVGQLRNLGNAQVPRGLPAASTETLARLFRAGFLDTFRLVLRICAALSWASALLAALLVRRPRPEAPFSYDDQPA